MSLLTTPAAIILAVVVFCGLNISLILSLSEISNQLRRIADSLEEEDQ